MSDRRRSEFRKKTPALDRVMANVAPIPMTGCLVWLGNTVGQGYGRIKDGARLELTHRLTYAAVRGPIPDGMVVMHDCDVPACCNPAHLSLGTQRDNIVDMATKGRHGQQTRAVCRNGHELTDDNITIRRGALRSCLACLRASQARSNANRRQA